MGCGAEDDVDDADRAAPLETGLLAATAAGAAAETAGAAAVCGAAAETAGAAAVCGAGAAVAKVGTVGTAVAMVGAGNDAIV